MHYENSFYVNLRWQTSKEKLFNPINVKLYVTDIFNIELDVLYKLTVSNI